MATITLQDINTLQINHILDYVKKENINYRILDSEDEFLYKEMTVSEQSGKGDFNKVMEFLQA
jgi:hypothetical protein